MPDVQPYFEPGNITAKCDVDVTGQRFVAPVGNLEGDVAGSIADGGYPVVGYAAAAKQLGVAARDKTTGDFVTVFRTGWVLPVTVGTGGVTAGDQVEADASGQAVTLAAGVAAGLALETAAAGATAMVAVY